MPLDISYHFPHGFKRYYFSWDHVINKREQDLGETLNEKLVILFIQIMTLVTTVMKMLPRGS